MSLVQSPPIVNHKLPCGEDWDEELRRKEKVDWDERKRIEGQGRPLGHVDAPSCTRFPKKKKKGKRGSRRPDDPVQEEAVWRIEGRGLQTDEWEF